jgi:4-hydroxy-3-polyprenylbenzoate decarboxylase
MFGNVDWSRDVIIQDGPVDALDHASYNFAFGGKIGIDATRKWPEEGYARDWPELVRMSDEIKERVTRRWELYGLNEWQK